MPALKVEWYGSMRKHESPFEEAKAYMAAHQLESIITLHPVTADARAAYWSADAVILASFYEGLPNTICEAMACGKPVLASNVCDNARLVLQGKNGLLF